jgi:hypothetical protein
VDPYQTDAPQAGLSQPGSKLHKKGVYHIRVTDQQ